MYSKMHSISRDFLWNVEKYRPIKENELCVVYVCLCLCVCVCVCGGGGGGIIIQINIR